MFGFTTLIKPKPQKVIASEEENLEEYHQLALRLNVRVPTVYANKFLVFMVANDLPIYSLPVVIKYMDKIAKRDGNGYGWLWSPMREEDIKIAGGHINWGKKYRNGEDTKKRPASDYYEIGRWPTIYQLPIPMRVLSRALLIQNRSPFTPAFFISDYATKDDTIKPDPFLLAYIPEIDERFVVDFWDEPGFGINEMLSITKEP